MLVRIGENLNGPPGYLHGGVAATLLDEIGCAYITLHYTTLHYTTLHYTTLHNIT